MGRIDEEVVPLIAPIPTLGQAALFEEIGRELRVATSGGQVGKMAVAMSLRGELREIRLHGEVTGKEVVEFGRRDASLDDVFIRFIHSAKLRIFLPFSVDRHFFDLHPERSDMVGAIDNKPQRIERPERLRPLAEVDAGVLVQDVPCRFFQFGKEVRLVVVKAFH